MIATMVVCFVSREKNPVSYQSAFVGGGRHTINAAKSELFFPIMFRFYPIVSSQIVPRREATRTISMRVASSQAARAASTVWSCPSSSSSSSFRRRAARGGGGGRNGAASKCRAARDDDDDDVVNDSDADRADAGPDAFSGSILQDVRKGQDGFTTELRIKRPGGEKDPADRVSFRLSGIS